MSDVFSLAPEGQAWIDDKTVANPARPEDYDPTPFQGFRTALLSGVAEGALGLAQSAVGFSKRLISDPAFTADVAPTVNIFREMFPDADKTLNDTYDTIGKQLQDARSYVKPDAGSQGMAAEVLNELGKFVPAIGTTMFGGPLIGAATAFSSTYEQSYQDFKGKGVDEATARNLATQQSLFNAVGMALPAAVGTTLATRIASGVAINTGFGGLNRYSVGATLEEKGYTEMAKQYRVFDGQAMLVDAVLGGVFGGVHHLTTHNNHDGTESNISAEEIKSTFGEHYQQSPDGNIESMVRDLSDSGVIELINEPAIKNSDGEILLNKGHVTVASGKEPIIRININGLKDHEELLETLHHEALHLEQRHYPDWKARKLANAVLKSANKHSDYPEFAYGMSQYYEYKKRGEYPETYPEWLYAEEVAAHAVNPSLKTSVSSWEKIISGFKAYIFRYSGIQVGTVTPEQLRLLVSMRLRNMKLEAAVEKVFGIRARERIKPSDIDAAHILNEGLHYDIESSPVLHTSNESINSHVDAMDEAYRQLNDGQPVNVGGMARGLDGPLRSDISDTYQEQYHEIQKVFEENGVRYETSSEPISESPVPRAESAFSSAGEHRGDVSVDPDTGQVLSSNSYDLMAARDMAVANPELTIAHPETGNPTKLSDLLAELDEQIKTVQNESKVYSVAAACFLRNP